MIIASAAFAGGFVTLLDPFAETGSYAVQALDLLGNTAAAGHNMTADGELVEVRVRATNIFRKEKVAGKWYTITQIYPLN